MNVAEAMNQLLSMYRPKDGITAYEHVLKALLVILEDFDSSIQQLISLVPFPNDASEEQIKDVIQRTTGLIMTNLSFCHNPVSMNQLTGKLADQSGKIVNPFENTVTYFRNAESNEKYCTTECHNSERLVSSVPEVFCGFPANEISMVHTHVKNLNNAYDFLESDRASQCTEMKLNYDKQASSSGFQSSLRCNYCCTQRAALYKDEFCKSFVRKQCVCMQSLDINRLHIPVNKANNYGQYGPGSKVSQQSNYFGCNAYRNEMILNKLDGNTVLNLKIKKENTLQGQEAKNNSSYFLKTNPETKTVNNESEGKRNFNFDTLKQVEEETRMEQQALREDLYKMDFVRWNEKNQEETISERYNDEGAKSQFPSLAQNLVAQTNLKTSIGNFLKRIREENSAGSSKPDRSLNIHSEALDTSSGSKYLKPFPKNLESDGQSEPAVNHTEDFAQADKSKEGTAALETIDKSACKQTGTNYAKIGKCDTVQLQVLKNKFDTNLGKVQTSRGTKESPYNPVQRYAVKRSERNNAKVLQQATSASDLTYKKQYYDALLCIQKAKVAMANSLAMSTAETSTKYDPYYRSYSYQQQQLLRRREQLMVRPQFAVHTVTQSGLTNMHSAPYTWVRCNNWRHPFVGQFKVRSQSSHPRSKEWMPQCKRTMDNQSFMQEKNQQAKQCVQRKKLEDIVGKLKEMEQSNPQN